MPLDKADDNARMPYQLPMPRECQPEIVVPDAIPEDERLWVPQAENVWFRPLCLNVIPRLADNDPFDGARRPAGQARSAARCFRIGQGPQRTGRAAARHRRPGSLERSLRCAPLVVDNATARTAPDVRSREPGQMGHYQRALVLAKATG